MRGPFAWPSRLKFTNHDLQRFFAGLDVIGIKSDRRAGAGAAKPPVDVDTCIVTKPLVDAKGTAIIEQPGHSGPGINKKGNQFMKRSISLFLPVFALVLLSTSRAHANEQKIKESAVPQKVLEAVTAKYPSAKKIGFEKEIEDGKTTYEVKLEDGARKIDIDFSTEGKILAEEEKIDFKALPDTAKNAFTASKYGKWTVKGAEKVIKEENEADPSYEIMVVKGDKRFEIVLDKDGNITKEEEKHAKKKIE